MNYSFIPPILVVLSLTAIIVFLFKKSRKISEIKEVSQSIMAASEVKKSFPQKIRKSFERVSLKKTQNGLLIFLEKMIRLIRNIFLKMEVIFGGWVQSLRKKRSKESLENLTQTKEADVMEKVWDYKFEDIKKNTSEFQPASVINKEKEEEKAIRPTISEKVVKPKIQTEIKSRLEELLIERVASNPRDVEAYERLGEYYFEMESFEFAKECFKQILKLNPSNRNAKYKIRRLENLLSK
jgi:tetratricopeptide (TPR) repeat protein